jgi:hypothetical protein
MRSDIWHRHVLDTPTRDRGQRSTPAADASVADERVVVKGGMADGPWIGICSSGPGIGWEHPLAQLGLGSIFRAP